MIRALILDFGGVLAEEGFREGLIHIARSEGLDPSSFFRKANELVYSTGYVTGHADETVFWDCVRKASGVLKSNEYLREEILKRFTVRPHMIKIVKKVRSGGIKTVILSDQTDWLEIIDGREHFYKDFDHVFNSFRIHRSKKDPSTFGYVCSEIGMQRDETVFVDDNEDNIVRASRSGMHTVHFTTIADFERTIRRYVHLS